MTVTAYSIGSNGLRPESWNLTLSWRWLVEGQGHFQGISYLPIGIIPLKASFFSRIEMGYGMDRNRNEIQSSVMVYMFYYQANTLFK